MFEPIRGGTRGGQGEFKWSDVQADKDRENYLGHSINAPAGRWQKNKDIHWYNREAKIDEAKRLEEIRIIKEAEADAMSVALGFGPSPTNGSDIASGSNSTPVNNVQGAVNESREAEKEARKLRKAERAAKRKARHLERESRHAGSQSKDRYVSENESRKRSKSPVRQESDSIRKRAPRRYDEPDREVEKEQSRHLWDANKKQEISGQARWGR